MHTLHPPYIPLVQKPCCCAVTCLQMILYRRGYGLFDQEALAEEFDVRVAPEYLTCFSTPRKPYTINNFDEGIATVESAAEIQEFFDRNAVALKVEAFRFSEIGDLDALLQRELTANNDIWLEYKSHRIHATDLHQGDYIHDGLVESYDPQSKSLTIIDPFYFHPPRISVSLHETLLALGPSLGRETGLLLVMPK